MDIDLYASKRLRLIHEKSLSKAVRISKGPVYFLIKLTELRW